MVSTPAKPDILYPDSDGQPMSDNTRQFRWIVTLKENLEALFAENPEVFVAGDLLWYPVEGDNKLRRAPDAMVVFGRPKGDRGSYKQWEEAGIAPQVVFEILSPRNTLTEMALKLDFYDQYGVEEYYLYDPEASDLSGWQRQEGRLRAIADIDGWVSPRLGIRFDLSGEELAVFYPDGERFESLAANRQARQQAEQVAQRAIDQLASTGLTADQIAAALALPLERVQRYLATEN